jgi:hypothetical protein
MDGALAWFVGVSFAALRGLQDSCGDDFAIRFRLTDVLKRLTNEVVCLVRGVTASGSKDKSWKN